MNTNTTTPKETNAAKQGTGEGWMGRLVRHLLCAWSGHAIYSLTADDGNPLRRSPVDDWIETECLRCGKTLRAPYGLALPNIKLGPPPS